jgi:hypothetical protein
LDTTLATTACIGCPPTGHDTGAVRSQEPQLLQEIIFTSRLMSHILRIETILLVQLFNNFTERHSLIIAITSTSAVTTAKNTFGVTALSRRWQPWKRSRLRPKEKLFVHTRHRSDISVSTHSQELILNSCAKHLFDHYIINASVRLICGQHFRPKARVLCISSFNSCNTLSSLTCFPPNTRLIQTSTQLSLNQLN